MKKDTILILNGPNLNMLGQREIGIYGIATLSDIEKLCASSAEKHGFLIDFKQSNHEGELVEMIQSASISQNIAGIVINPAAYTHSSIAIMDALKLMVEMPIYEVHLSNVARREDFRQISYISLVATGVISGLGVNGYLAAINAIATTQQCGISLDESISN